MSFFLPAADSAVIDRLGRPLEEDRSSRSPVLPVQQPSTMRLGASTTSCVPARLFHNSLGPRRRIGRPRATTAFVCLERWARGRQSSSSSNQGMEIAVGGNQRMKLAEPRPSVHGGGRGRSIAFQGQKLRSPRQPTNEDCAGRREAERSHPREGARLEEGSVRAWRFGPFPCWTGCHFGNGRTRARVFSALEKESQGPAGMGARGGQHQ
jgi:hypothetical protein